MLPDALYVIDNDRLLALYLHIFSLENRPKEIVLCNGFLQEWLGKSRIHNNALEQLENALRNFFPDCNQGYRANKELILPCNEQGPVFSFERNSKLNLSKVSNELGFSNYSMVSK